ncbi:hypothetical protein Tco_0986091 [Tanacetum coccineum]
MVVCLVMHQIVSTKIPYLVDKPKPVGLNENLDIEEDFDLFFCDLDPDSSELNASEVPNVGEPSEMPNVGEPSEVPNVGESSKVPNVGESSEVPNVADQTEMPNVADQTEMPNVADQTEMPNVREHSDGSEDSEDNEDGDFDVELEDKIDDVDVDMDDLRKFTDENVEWVGPNEVLVEDTQPVEDEVFEDVDLEDFESASDPYDIDSNRKKSLKKLARKHKPVDGKIYTDKFYCGQTFANK